MKIQPLATRLIGLLLAGLPAACSLPTPEPAGVVIAGDGRTAADATVPGSAGWGEALTRLLRTDAPVHEMSAAGGTLENFVAGGEIERALGGHPAFLIVGFGQGDADAGTPLPVFTAHLRRLIDAARAAGATPVLVTPPVLRTIDPTTGRASAGIPAPADAQPYADALARAASDQGAALIDLRAAMRAEYAEVGDRANWFLHPPLDVAREPASNVRAHKEWRAPTARRATHFSATGAESVAHQVALLMRSAGGPLAALLRPEDGPPVPGYELVWRDEFDGTRWDTNSWACREAGPRKDGMNDPACLRLDGQGHLVIDIKQVGDRYHAGMLSTAGLREWTHGYFECRMTLAREEGFWNAFWFMSDTVGRPQRDPSLADQTRRIGTEIDVVEYLRSQGDTVHLNLHWNGYGDLHRSSPFDIYVPGLRAQEWHVFGVEWTTDGYAFYVDGRHAWTTQDAPSDTPEYIILSVEIGKWAGDIHRAKLPQEVKVDWVRVWQRKPLTPPAT